MNALTSLVTKRGNPSDPPPPGPKSSRLPATLLPVGILIGFLLLFAWLFGGRLLPKPTVEVISVVTLPATDTHSNAPIDSENNSSLVSNAYEAEPLFQASGWVEADPYPIRAVALTSGVVDEVLVLEGETVQKGQLLANLISEDAQLRFEAARAQWERKKAELAVATSDVESREANLNLRSARVEVAQAQLEEAMDEMKRLRDAGNQAIPENRIRQAQFRVQAREAEIAAAQAAQLEAQSQWEAAKHTVEVIRSEVESSRVRKAEARLALDRTQIFSPIKGIVQRLLAAPGQKKMLQMDNPESATIALLFHPNQLQARIDVPLEQAAQLAIGQPVWIRSNFLPDTQMRGRVTRIVGEADLQRNTLQAKVAIEKPDPRLRPDMLCRAEFLPLPQTNADSTHSMRSGISSVQLFVPTQSLLRRDSNRAQVWTVGLQSQRLNLRDIELRGQEDNGFIHVTQGLQPGDRVVLTPSSKFSPGQKVRPILTEFSP